MPARVPQKLLDALAAGLGPTAAAKAAGVSVSTVKRRLRDPRVLDAVEARRSDLLTATAAQLVAAGTAAVVTLTRVMRDEQAPPAARVAAAKAALSAGLTYRAAADTEARLAALEALHAPPAPPAG